MLSAWVNGKARNRVVVTIEHPFGLSGSCVPHAHGFVRAAAQQCSAAWREGKRQDFAIVSLGSLDQRDAVHLPRRLPQLHHAVVPGAGELARGGKRQSANASIVPPKRNRLLLFCRIPDLDAQIVASARQAAAVRCEGERSNGSRVSVECAGGLSRM